MIAKYCRWQRDGDVAIVTIDRPPVNALNSEAYEELGQLFGEMAGDDGIRAVVITGAGEKAFVAGADVTEFLTLDSASGEAYTRRNNGVREQVRIFPRPVIAAINGLALGGGCVLALMCDIRIASEKARFSLAEINMGIVGGTQFISRMIPLGRAKELVFAGEMIDADEALRIGLVDRVVPQQEVLERAMDLARRIATKAPVALYLAKRAVNEGLELPLTEALELETQYLRELWGTQDKNEAVRAFLEKRPPAFLGR
ncbi:MAG: enoyl-CoA hydratase-related protein [Chloroflexi bacterium]|nr:enoyl-CoA hydratase-related protein [Chloroflexota bacterium]